MILLLNLVVQSFLSRMSTKPVIQKVCVKGQMFKESFHETSHAWIFRECPHGFVIQNYK